MTKNFFDLANFALRCAGDLFTNAFAFHVTIVRGASGDFFSFAFNLAAGAFCPISNAALHTFYFSYVTHRSAASGRALPESRALADEGG